MKLEKNSNFYLTIRLGNPRPNQKLLSQDANLLPAPLKIKDWQ